MPAKSIDFGLYMFLNGSTANLLELDRPDLAWLMWFMQKAWMGIPFTELKLLVASAYAYPLKGSPMVTRVVKDSLLYQVADDIANRAGIYQSKIGKNPGDVI